MNAPWLRRLIVAALIAALVVLAFEILQPFIVPVIWAVILAHVTWPAYRRLLRAFRGRSALAALVLTLLVSAVIIVPSIWVITLIRTEVVVAYAKATALLAQGVQVPQSILNLPIVGPWLAEMLASMRTDPGALNVEISAWVNQFAGELGGILGGLGRNIAKLFIAMLSLFFVYRDGAALFAQLTRVLEQILGARIHNYLSAIGDTVKGVVYGLLAAAIAQGTIAGVGYWAAGLNAPVTLAALSVLAALIPFASPIVWGAASLWLLLIGKTAAAIGLFLWGLLAVSWIDNIVRPLVISNVSRIPFLLVLFGVLGGVAAFGLVGLFVGPVILAVLVAVWREWLAEKHATP